MKKNNYFLLTLCLLSFVACTKEKVLPSLASSWQSKYLFTENTQIRKVASAEKGVMCFEDKFNSASLQKEVADYEHRITGSPVKGSWRHLDLAKLPIPQANFLKGFGMKIGDVGKLDSINYDGCSTLPCIFNRIYQRDEFDVAGYVHYLWYLKFGNYLSLDNDVPDQSGIPGTYNNKQFDMADYLFSNDELYGLWKITHMLQAPYTSLSNLYVVQRIPSTEIIEGRRENVCGAASTLGTIRLNHNCLRIDPKDKNQGQLYVDVIHEISHMLDLLQSKDSDFRSFHQDYLDLVGFLMGEFADKYGKIHRGWELKKDTGTVSGYAAFSPAEHFAETLAHFRSNGDKTKAKIDKSLFDWVSSNYFHNQTYDKSGNRARFLQNYETLFSNDVLSKIVSCFSTDQNFPSRYFSPSDFSQKSISPKIINCMGFEAEEIAKRLTAHVQLNDPDGCKTLDTKEDRLLWDTSVKVSLKKQFTFYLQELTKDPQYLANIQNFNATLKKRAIANQAIFECYQGSTLDNLKNCYEEKAMFQSKSEALQLRFSQAQAQDMANLYLTTHPYVRVSADLFLAYRTFLSSHDSLVGKESENLWKMCLNSNHSDDFKPTGSLFAPRKGYLVSSIYNCLNAQIPTTLKGIVRAVTLDGEKIKHPVEEQIMLEFLAPRVNERLYTLHEKAMEEEGRNLAAQFSKISAGLRSNLISDFSWAKTLSDSKKVDEDCLSQGITQMTYLPLFHLKREAYSQMILSGPCRDITSESAFKNFFDKLKQNDDPRVFSHVEAILEEYAKRKAESCKTTIPWAWERTRGTVRTPRKACLNSAWGEVEDDTIKQLMSNADAAKLGFKESEYRSYMSKIRSSVQSKIEKNHF